MATVSNLADTEALVLAIGRALTGEAGQYQEIVEGWNAHRVDLIRRCGRAAAQRRHLQARTFTSDLAAETVTVLVVRRDAPDRPLVRPVEPRPAARDRTTQRLRTTEV